MYRTHKLYENVSTLVLSCMFRSSLAITCMLIYVYKLIFIMKIVSSNTTENSNLYSTITRFLNITLANKQQSKQMFFVTFSVLSQRENQNLRTGTLRSEKSES